MSGAKKRILSLLLTSCMIIVLMPSTIFASRSAKETVDAVPAEALVIENGIYYGISKTWFAENNPSKEIMYLSVKIPDNVTTIAKDGLIDSYGCRNNTNHICKLTS